MPQAGANELQQWQRRIAIDGLAGAGTLELAYLAAGDAQGVRLILVHGTPGDAAGWAAYLQNPPPGTEVFAIDRPGFGRSGPRGAVTSLAAQARAVAALLPTDGRRALLLGHSLGGPIVAQVAAEHPQAVAGVILLSASLDPALEEIHPMQHVGNWAPIRALLPRAIRNANAELLALQPELVALARLLPSVTAPVFIVHGSADELVPVANVPYMQNRLSGARCQHTTLLQGRNHFLPWNSEAAVREAIAAALQAAQRVHSC
jgi:pimeloyl-ACP methyl ester carboxylesterase